MLLPRTVLAWAFFTSYAWAASSSEAEVGTRNFIIMLTVFIALLIGMLLYQYAQRSSKAQFTGTKQEPSDQAGPAQGPASTLMPAILTELNQLQAPAQERQRVARSVADIVSKTVEAQVGQTQRQLTERYEQVVQEHRRTQTELQGKYQQILQESKQTTAVLESIAEGLVVVNTQGEIVMMNPAAARLLAVNPHDRLGKSLLEELHEGELVSLVRGSSEDREIVLSAKQDSTKRVLRASNAVITDENGKAVGMVAVLSDVTKQREVEQLKSEFLSKVSHELRTPVVAMQHALSILSDGVAGAVSEEQLKFITLTQRNLDRLNGLLNDLLDLAKLEAKRMELRLESASIGAIVSSVCESLEVWAKGKSIAIVRRVPERLPPAVCDEGRIAQVLTNLIGNAIKFTPNQGRVTVEAQLAQGGDAIEISVTDTGVGIAKEDLPKLFHKFQQVGERSATDISGTGLGLSIVKELVELHHGHVWAESDAARKGAKFAFTLPLSHVGADSSRR